MTITSCSASPTRTFRPAFKFPPLHFPQTLPAAARRHLHQEAREPGSFGHELRILGFPAKSDTAGGPKSPSPLLTSAPGRLVSPSQSILSLTNRGSSTRPLYSAYRPFPNISNCNAMPDPSASNSFLEQTGSLLSSAAGYMRLPAIASTGVAAVLTALLYFKQK
jgi:hypothetical protein